MKRKKMFRAFTLIELLIVIAIILILIAIALPNFMAAKIRATVAQARSEMRTFATAIEAYASYYNEYPYLLGKIFHLGRGSEYDHGGSHLIYDLTTPIAFISSDVLKKGDPFLRDYPRNAFGDLLDPPDRRHYSYAYVNVQLFRRNQWNPRSPFPEPPKLTTHFAIYSLGPDTIKGPDARDGGPWKNRNYALYPPPAPFYDPMYDAWNYNPTNGTRSAGDILLFR